MGDFATYSLSDFILFSQATYYRQFELYNQAVWPAHVIAVILSCMMLYALWKRPARAGRFVAVILSASWLWVAWAFLYLHFYKIHVVANWYAYGFYLQAGLLAWYGIIQKRFSAFTTIQWRINAGAGLLLTSLVVYPFMPVITGRSWLQFEMFFLVPDPVVLATLGVFLLYRPPKVLYLVPCTWVLLSGVTLLAM